jgi:hypothetical protein
MLDPIAQAPQAAWHVCSTAGEKFGPVPGETLRQWISQRRLLPDSLVWREGWAEWQRADIVFVELAAGPPPPAVAVPMSAGFPAAEPPAMIESFPREPARSVASRGYSRRSKNSHVVLIILLILGVLALAPLLGYVLIQQF